MGLLRRISLLHAALFLCLGQNAHCATSGSDALNYLKDVLKQNREQLDQVDGNFKKLLNRPINGNITREGQIKKVSDERHELVLRQEFLDRLVFRIDSRYLGGDLQQFLVTQLNDMVVVEASDAQGDTSLWKFMTSLASALHDQVERSENLAYFIEGYMKFSSISKPIRPDEYVKVRSYSNGQDSYSARPVAKENLGEIVERRLRALPAGSISTKIDRN